jgi:hypothetical protein
VDSLQTLDYVFLFLYIVEQLVKVVRQGYSRGTLRGTRAARQGSAAYQSRAWSPAMPSMASGGIGQNRRRSQVRVWAKLSACGCRSVGSASGRTFLRTARPCSTLLCAPTPPPPHVTQRRRGRRHSRNQFIHSYPACAPIPTPSRHRETDSRSLATWLALHARRNRALSCTRSLKLGFRASPRRGASPEPAARAARAALLAHGVALRSACGSCRLS